MPEHPVIQSDNTVSQSKNTYVHIALAYLVAIKQFKSVSLNYLMVGHTHEDIDQLFRVSRYFVVRRHVSIIVTK